MRTGLLASILSLVATPVALAGVMPDGFGANGGCEWAKADPNFGLISDASVYYDGAAELRFWETACDLSPLPDGTFKGNCSGEGEEFDSIFTISESGDTVALSSDTGGAWTLHRCR